MLGGGSMSSRRPTPQHWDGAKAIEKHVSEAEIQLDLRTLAMPLQGQLVKPL